MPCRTFGQYGDRPPSEYRPCRLPSTAVNCAGWDTLASSERPSRMCTPDAARTSVVISVNAHSEPSGSARLPPNAALTANLGAGLRPSASGTPVTPIEITASSGSEVPADEVAV